MPYDFAERLFDLTKLGMRVIVAPNDVAPASIAHPALFQPKPDAGAVAAARAAEADEAASKADKARLAAIAASREVAQAMLPVRVMRNLKLRSEAQLAAAESAITSAGSAEAKEQAEDAKAKAAARITEIEAQLAAAEAELIPKYDALAAARLAAAAETARAEAAEVAREAARAPAPVSLFISRKTQRLMSGRPPSPSWKFRSQSKTPIFRLARTSLPPWSSPATASCNGAWSHWLVDIQKAARRTYIAPQCTADASSRH
jgi:multidrug efflux pump subunit AcrA (membrane-fusion protein)